MDSQGRRQVDLVTRARVSCRREIAEEYPLCRGDEIQTSDCCRARNDSGCSGCPAEGKQGRACRGTGGIFWREQWPGAG